MPGRVGVDNWPIVGVYPTTVFDLTCAAEGAAGGNFGGDPDELLDREFPILSARLGICQATALGLFRHREWFGGSFSGFDSKTSG